MGTYIRLIEYGTPDEKEKAFLSGSDRYVCDVSNFKRIPGNPYAYWLPEQFLKNFNSKKIEDVFNPKFGMSTGDGKLFIRLWFELKREDFCNDLQGANDDRANNVKWVALDKGGAYRKWYGNRLNAVWWKDNGRDIKNHPKSAVRSPQLFFTPHISWTLISTSKFSARYFENGFAMDTASNCIYFNGEPQKYVLAFLNSCVADTYLNVLNPTMNFSCGVIGLLPYIEEKDDYIEQLAERCVELSKADWDDNEVSWDFIRNPLVDKETLIRESYFRYDSMCKKRNDELNVAESKIDEYFIQLYGLNGLIDNKRNDNRSPFPIQSQEEAVKELISYAVGCIMGRYSLKEDGLIYAGGNWNDSRYPDAFKPCEYGVLPITEEQFFEEDLCSRVIDFFRVVYGDDYLNENLKYIATSIRPDSYDSPKKIIREYLFKDFFDDHYQMYQHRPIYWQLDSGKAGGFRAIAYMHRFTENTLPLVRTEFIQDLRYKYEEEMQRQKGRLEGASSTAEANAIKKDITALDKKIVECAAYDELLNHATSSIQNYMFNLDDGVKTNYAKFLSIDGDKNSNILTVIKL